MLDSECKETPRSTPANSSSLLSRSRRALPFGKGSPQTGYRPFQNGWSLFVTLKLSTESLLAHSPQPKTRNTGSTDSARVRAGIKEQRFRRFDGQRVQSTAKPWPDPEQLNSDFHPSEVLRSALIRATDAVAVDAVSTRNRNRIGATGPDTG